jgi:hypothetical protein
MHAKKNFQHICSRAELSKKTYTTLRIVLIEKVMRSEDTSTKDKMQPITFANTTYVVGRYNVHPHHILYYREAFHH